MTYFASAFIYAQHFDICTTLHHTATHCNTQQHAAAQKPRKRLDRCAALAAHNLDAVKKNGGKNTAEHDVPLSSNCIQNKQERARDTHRESKRHT